MGWLPECDGSEWFLQLRSRTLAMLGSMSSLPTTPFSRCTLNAPNCLNALFIEPPNPLITRPAVPILTLIYLPGGLYACLMGFLLLC